MMNSSKNWGQLAFERFSFRRAIAIVVASLGLVVSVQHWAAPMTVTLGYIFLTLALLLINELWLVVLPIGIVLGNGYP